MDCCSQPTLSQWFDIVFGRFSGGRGNLCGSLLQLRFDGATVLSGAGLQAAQGFFVEMDGQGCHEQSIAFFSFLQGMGLLSGECFFRCKNRHSVPAARDKSCFLMNDEPVEKNINVVFTLDTPKAN